MTVKTRKYASTWLKSIFLTSFGHRMVHWYTFFSKTRM